MYIKQKRFDLFILYEYNKTKTIHKKIAKNQRKMTD